MSSYFIAQINIIDPELYNEYLAGFDQVFAKYKGEVIIVDDNPIVLEGEWSFTRIVVIRFPSTDEAKRWYESSEYQLLAQYRHQASKADIILAKELD
ncbi:DUF1330 domain-containing protein [Candidatus Neomarinimicrobiota bacterium]